jgi:protein-disulfide isomerase
VAKQTRKEDSGSGMGTAQIVLGLLAAGALVLAGLGFQKARTLETKMTALDGKIIEMAKGMQAVQAMVQQAQGRRGPDPNKVYPVNTAGSPIRGVASAPVTIAEFSDFQCPFCSRVGPTLERVMQVYGDKVRIVWKNNPLAMHKDAPLAHLAAAAAAEQGKFWQYHDKLFANQQRLKRNDLIQYASDLGLDTARFTQVMDSDTYKGKISADANEAASLGVTGTPAFFVNGRFLSGAQPFEKFAALINGELTRLGIPVPPEAAVGG